MATIYWNTTANGQWNDAADWNTGTVPGAGDDAVLGVTGFAITQNYTVTATQSLTINSITFTDNGAVLAINGPTIVTVVNNVDVDGGDIELQYGGGLTVGGDLITVSGNGTNSYVDVDTQTDYNDNPSGGSVLSIAGALQNGGTISIGNFLLSSATTVTADALTNTGTINITGDNASGHRATIDILGMAPATVAGAINVGGYDANGGGAGGNALLEFGSGEINAIAAGGSISISNPNSFIADADVTTSNSALTGLTSNAGFLGLQYDVAASLSGNLTNTGTLELDDSTDYGDDPQGGSTLTIAGTLTNAPTTQPNTGVIAVGNPGLTAVSEITAAALDNTGTINLVGNNLGGNQAILDIAASAPKTITGSINIGGGDASAFGFNNVRGNGGDALLEFGSGEINAIAAGAELTLSNPNSFVADAGHTGSSSALTGLTNNAGFLGLEYNVPLSLGGNLTNTGTLDLDDSTDYGDDPQGGSTLTIAGTLINTPTSAPNTGIVDIGNNALTANTTLTAGALDNTGTINITGDDASGHTATMDILGAAPATVTGAINLGGYDANGDGTGGDALLEFGSGQITSIAAGGSISISNPNSFIADAGHTGSSSALAGLTSNAGFLGLQYGVPVSLGGNLTNTGTLDLDDTTDYGDDPQGGSTLTIAGTLTNTPTANANTGVVNIGNVALTAPTTLIAAAIDNSGTINLTGNWNSGTAHQATLDITGAAPTSWTGALNVTGDALVEFGSGSITDIAAGGAISLGGTGTAGGGAVGKQSFIADASDTASNGALSGLSSIEGLFRIADGALVTLAGSLTNSGSLDVDEQNGYWYNPGGNSALSIAGTLTNAGTANFGSVVLQAPIAITAAALDNTASGTINLTGNWSSGSTDQATLDITGQAPTTWTGTLNMTGDALLEFGSGSITDIAASGAISLGGTGTGGGGAVGKQVFVADANDLTANGALTGLTSIEGLLRIADGVAVTLSGNLTNSGTLDVDEQNGYWYNPGGNSVLSIAGTLTNSDTANFGSGALQAPIAVTAAALDNTATGTINLAGNWGNGATQQAVLDILGAAPTTWTGTLNVTGDALLEFGSGSITDIAATGAISIGSIGISGGEGVGQQSFIADAGATTSNSALTGLTSNEGLFQIEDGVAVALSGNFTNSNTLNVDQQSYWWSSGGSTLTIAGTFTNSGSANIGNGAPSAATTFTAAAVDNTATGQLTVIGGIGDVTTFDVVGAVQNADQFYVYNGADAQVGSFDNQSDGTIRVWGSQGLPAVFQVLGNATNEGTISLGSYGEIGLTGTLTDSGVLTDGGSLDLGGAMELTGTGTLQMQGGSIITPDGSSLTLDSGATAGGNGTIAVGITNNSTITASGGLLDLTGPITGSGQLAVASGAELELGGTTAQNVSFNGNVGTLKLDDPASFTGAITGLVAGDTIDLAGVQATGAVLNGSTLTVTAGSQTFTYQVAGPGLANDTFAIQDDQQGGTDLTLGAAGPVISGPTSQEAFLGWPTLLGPLTIADPNAGNGTLTVTITCQSGTLDAVDINGDPLPGSGSNRLTLSGDLTDINTMLASVTYNGPGAGVTDNVQIVARDASDATAAQTIIMTTGTVPFTETLINLPSLLEVISGIATAFNGISVSDPYAVATGQQVSLQGLIAVGSLSATGGNGGTVVGQDTNNLTINGTISQLNSYFADAVNAQAVAAAIINRFWMASGAPAVLTILKLITAFGNALKSGNVGAELTAYQQLQNALYTEGTYLAQVVQEFVGPVGNLLRILALEAKKAYSTNFGDPVTFDGLSYKLNASGEFVLAQSTTSGDSFDVQVRMEPFTTSQSLSVDTEVAAAVGSDRVTFALDRGATVWVDGNPANVAPAQPVVLSAGQISQIGPDTYVVSWNTGEALTVVDDGISLEVSVALGSNDEPGSIVGLFGPDEGSANDFTLPDGTVLQQPLTDAQLYQTFANAWRVTDATSLFDYGPGQSTATFTNTNFPEDSISLTDLPTSVVAIAAQAVAATGITDAGAFAAMEYDYIASGGNPSVLAADASEFQGLSTTPAQITESTPAPSVIGVIVLENSVQQTQSGPTAVTFDVYLTGSESSTTEVDYQVISPDANDFTAADFGGTLPSGTMVIPANQAPGTLTPITIDVPQGALGNLPSKDVDLQISTPSGVPIFAPDSVEAVSSATATPPSANGAAPAVPQIDYLGAFGTFSQIGNSYTLDLGTITYGETLPALQFAIANGASSPGDELSGSFSWPTVAGFDVSVDGNTTSGASLLSPIAAGSSDQALTVTTVQDKFGAQSETITFNPLDTNSSGYSSAQTPITLTIEDTLQVPGTIYSQAWGDVHIVTYNGLTYNFQAAGEFTLAQSEIAGDSFDIQLRLQPYTTSGSVTYITQVAASVGTDDLTFSAGLDQPATVRDNGVVLSSLSMSNPTVTLSGGTVTEISPTMFQVDWNTGETMTVTDEGFYFNVSDSVPYASFGEVHGLQGENEGAQSDFQLPNGTVLQQPLTSCELYGEYASAWQVTPATSLFYYAPGQSPATFENTNFPANQVTLADIPSSVLSQVAALVAAAGITDPNTAAQAELDYLASGDPSDISSGANVNQQVTGTTTATVTPCTTPVTAIGVIANALSVTEAASGQTALTFTAYLTGTASTATTIDYTVTDPGAAFLGAAAFGGTLPSGSVVIGAGQQTAQITVNLPQGALGALPDANLQLQVSSPGNALPIFAPTAQTEIVNNQPEAGNLAQPVLAYLGKEGAFTFDSSTNTYTLNLGDVVQGSSVVAAEFAVVNAAVAPADSLSGTFSYPTGEGFTVTGNNLTSPLAPGEVYQGLYTSINTADLGSNAMSLTFDPTDVNGSGYSQALAPITLQIVDDVTPPAVPQVNTPTTIIFPNVHVGGTDSQHVSVTNTAAAGAGDLDVTLTASGNATTGGAINQLAPGHTDASDLTVGIDTSTAGALAGSITENFSNDNGIGQTSPIAEENPYIDVFGSVYRLADASVSPGNLTVHVGDSGNQTITVTNLDPNDGYSENLIATVIGSTGAITTSSTTGEIAPQSDGVIKVNFSTASPGQVGTVTLDLKSDGTGIDGLGATDLGDVTVAVGVTSGNVPAAAQFEDISGGGTFTQKGAAYTLDLGTIAAATTINVGVLNSAAAPADALSGTFSVSGDTEFGNSGFAAFSSVAAGQGDATPTVTLFTGVAGTFSETITLDPTDAATATALPVETLTITGTVATTTPPVITAPSSVNVQQGQATAVTGISIADPDAISAAETITVALGDNAGLLSASTNAPNGGGTITGSGTIALMISGTLAQVNADLTTLTDNDSIPQSDSIAVSAADNVGGTAEPAIIQVTVGQTQQAATVGINPVDGNNVINNAEANASTGVPLSGSVSGLASGATFTVSVSDDGFSANYTATVNSAGTGWTATIPSSDAVRLADGYATVTATVSTSVTASVQITVAETLPTVAINKIDGNNVINYAAAHASAGVPLSGTVTGLASGATFSISVEDGSFANSYTATVGAGGTWTATIPSADAVTLGNGTATVSAQVTDQYGNQSSLASQSVTVAETVPTVTINKIDGNDVINNAEAHASSGVPLSGTVAGLGSGATFSVSVEDGSFANSYTATVGAGGTWTATIPSADAVTLGNGTATVSAQVTDQYGNQSSLASQSVTVAETLPTVTINKIDGNDVINNAEAHASSGVPLSGTVAGLGSGATFSISVKDGSFAKSYTATVGAGGTWTATIPSADAVTLGNGTATVSAQVTDQYGNQSLPVSQSVTVAETLPTVTINKINGNDIINNTTTSSNNCGPGGNQQGGPANVQLSGAVTGLAANSTFQVSVTDGTFANSYTATVSSGGTNWTATMPAADVALLPNGTATFSAKVTDQYGNVSLPASQTVTVEGSVTATINPVDGDNVINYAEAHASCGIVVTGTVSGLAKGTTFALDVVDGSFSKTYTATVGANNTWTATIPGADAVKLPNGTATVTAQVNSFVQAAENVTVVETLPTLTFNKVEGNNVINYADAHAAGGVPLSGTVTGLATGATFNVDVKDGSFSKTYTATVSAGGAWTATIPAADAAALASGTATVSAQVTDAYGNQATASQGVTVADKLPTLTINKINGNDVIDNSQSSSNCGGGGQGSALALSGSVSGLAGNSEFSLSVSDGSFAKTYTATVNAAGTAWTATMPAADVALLPNGTATFSAQVTDPYGNASALVSQSVTVNGTTPQVIGISASPSSGDLDAGKTVTIALTMNEAVKVIGSPTLALNDGGSASYVSAQSTATLLTFSYTVAAGQNTSDLSITSVNLPSGSSIKDVAGDTANMSGAVGKLGPQIDTTPPVVNAVVVSPSGGDVITGHQVTVTLDMSEPVAATESPTLLFNDGATANFDSAHSTSTALVFDYDVAAGQMTSDLKVAGVELPSSTSINDLAGNPADLTKAAADLRLGINSAYSPSSAPSVGTVTLTGSAELELFGASSAAITFASGAAAMLRLDSSTQFSGQIAGFGGQDQIDLSDISFGAHTSLAYQANSHNTGGTLTVSDGVHSAAIVLLGQYVAGSFAEASDGHGGTLISDPPLTTQNGIMTQPQHA